MSQLTMTAIPGFSDLTDGTLAAGQPITDDVMLKLSHNAKFAAVRTEILFMGFYAHGNTIPLPTSPVDGYAYVRAEVQYFWMIYSNRSPASGFVAGQSSPPSQSSSQQQDALYNFPGGWDIDDATGVVTLRTTYYSSGGSEVVTTDGIIKVYAICTRLSVSSSN